MTSTDPVQVLERLHSRRVIAVIRAPSQELAAVATSVLIKHGISGIEITFTTPDAAVAIETLRERHGDEAVIGAGTLITQDDVVAAEQAGAQFLVSPGIEAALTRAMVSTGLATMTGALTPSEVMAAQSHGAHVIKIFPASLGGPSYLSALKGPFPQLKFMPTGGVSAENLGQWFNQGAFAVGAGGDLVSGKALAAGDFDDIASRAGAYVAALAEYDHHRKEN